MTARNEADLDPSAIMLKIANSSGSNYSGDSVTAIAAPSTTSTSPPSAPSSTKPPRTFPSSPRATYIQQQNMPATTPPSQVNSTFKDENNDDDDGWGADAPKPTATSLESTQSAYRPVKVDLTEGKPASRFAASKEDDDDSNVVKSAYTPIGRPDINALRSQVSTHNDKPSLVKGTYEPVGKIDIAALRARAEGNATGPSSPPAFRSSSGHQEQQQTSPRSTSARFGGSNLAPSPALTSVPPAKSRGFSKNFTSEAGKTPSQLWAERKARQSSSGGDGGSPSSPSLHDAAHVPNRPSFETDQEQGNDEVESRDDTTGATSVSALRQRFANQSIISPSAPPTSRPPVRQASYAQEEEEQPAEEEEEPEQAEAEEQEAEPVPTPAIHTTRDDHDGYDDEAEDDAEPAGQEDEDLARQTSIVAAEENLQEPVATYPVQGAEDDGPALATTGRTAVVVYEYEKAEDNEMDLIVGETVCDIEEVGEVIYCTTSSSEANFVFKGMVARKIAGRLSFRSISLKLR